MKVRETSFAFLEIMWPHLKNTDSEGIKEDKVLCIKLLTE